MYQPSAMYRQLVMLKTPGVQANILFGVGPAGAPVVDPQVESLQNFTKTLAKQNDLEILEDRTQKAHGVSWSPRGVLTHGGFSWSQCLPFMLQKQRLET